VALAGRAEEAAKLVARAGGVGRRSRDGKTSGAVAISSIWGGDPDPNHRLGSGTSWKNTTTRSKNAPPSTTTCSSTSTRRTARGCRPQGHGQLAAQGNQGYFGRQGQGPGQRSPGAHFVHAALKHVNISVPQMLVLTRRRVDDFAFKNTPINEALVRDLAAGAFIAQQRNVVLVGGPEPDS
jgi:hypothetical protein